MRYGEDKDHCEEPRKHEQYEKFHNDRSKKNEGNFSICSENQQTDIQCIPEIISFWQYK